MATKTRCKHVHTMHFEDEHRGHMAWCHRCGALRFEKMDRWLDSTALLYPKTLASEPWVSLALALGEAEAGPGATDAPDVRVLAERLETLAQRVGSLEACDGCGGASALGQATQRLRRLEKRMDAFDRIRLALLGQGDGDR